MQVRVTPVKHWFKRGGTQDVTLHLHHQPAGRRKPQVISLAGWGCYDLLNISEKLVIAQAINSEISRVQSPLSESIVAENC